MKVLIATCFRFARSASYVLHSENLIATLPCLFTFLKPAIIDPTRNDGHKNKNKHNSYKTTKSMHKKFQKCLHK